VIRVDDAGVAVEIGRGIQAIAAEA